MHLSLSLSLSLSSLLSPLANSPPFLFQSEINITLPHTNADANATSSFFFFFPPRHVRFAKRTRFERLLELDVMSVDFGEGHDSTRFGGEKREARETMQP
ncbi:hypothetical protein ACJQWK_07519 [Exserohilum turcicum]